MEYVTVIKWGLFITVQDLGRKAFRVYSVSGVIDLLSFRLANILLCIPENIAVLKATLVAPKL